jgi:hypothetical protein
LHKKLAKYGKIILTVKRAGMLAKPGLPGYTRVYPVTGGYGYDFRKMARVQTGGGSWVHNRTRPQYPLIINVY